MISDRRFDTTLAQPTRDAVVVDLHATLIELIDLALQAKQLHWTVIGARFKSVHELLDELAASYRTLSDDLAERCTALGVSPDGTAQHVAERSGLPPLPAGFVADQEVLERMAKRVLMVAGAVRSRARRVAELDPGSEDLLLGVLRTLEQQAWMLQAQTLRQSTAQHLDRAKSDDQAKRKRKRTSSDGVERPRSGALLQ